MVQDIHTSTQIAVNPFIHPLYLSDISRLVEIELPWEALKDKCVAVSGASGLIGSCLVDAIMKRNSMDPLSCKVIAIGRNAKRAEERFAEYWDSPLFSFVTQDINLPFSLPGKIDYVVHLASNTHPVSYATEPVETIMTNITGLQNMLELARSCGAERFAFASSNEVYGQNRGDVELFDESYCGYIDCNTLRAGYPESKRCGEALCQAYARQYGMDVVIPRFTRCFGPTLLPSDTKALSQFLHNAVKGEEIVLKSDGSQYYSYIYVCDAVSALLTVLLKGEAGHAYNVADESCDVTLRDLAGRIAGISGTKVVFRVPDEVEKAGFSTATKARLASDKLKSLGWTAHWSIDEALRHSLAALSAL